jgi:hypothetical protein
MLLDMLKLGRGTEFREVPIEVLKPLMNRGVIPSDSFKIRFEQLFLVSDTFGFERKERGVPKHIRYQI